ncbi:hypothetical protein QTP86_031555 [Hemibagrus guttatus]|nr:hypothetical protein QTP86_031555 [Hemibagrus guttatus]
MSGSFITNLSTSSAKTKEVMEDLEETRSRLMCEQFATVTGSDSAVAQCYLAENDWDMERALNSFFEADMESVFDVEDTDEENNRPSTKRKETDRDGPESKRKMNSKPADCIDLTEDEPACSKSKDSSEEEGDRKLSLISWNVDGLDTLNIQERARGLCSYLALYTPDVVFLQELIPQYLQYLKKRAVTYQIVEGNEDGYFTAMMLKKSRVKLQSSEIIPYPTTQMMRNLLCAKVTFLGQEFCLMTSHLESCKDQAAERMKQLKVVLQNIKEEPDNMTVIFGGDTNLRDSEHLSLTRRNIHSISPSYVASCTFSSLPDHDSFSSLPLDSATDTLLSSLSSTMDLLCPLSTIRKKNSSTAPWLSDVLRNNRRELRSAARKWKKSKLNTDLISYRTLLSKFSLDVTSAKTSFYKEKLETSAQDPQKLHNIFSSLLNPPAPPPPSSLTAKYFATFYTEKIERICQAFTSLPTSPTSHSQHSATPSLTQLSTVAAEEVLKITRSCNPTTCPLDPVPSAMLQTISPDFLPFITTVINGSLTSGHVPSVFKKARVIPILKKSALDPSDFSNYRPVSLLSFLSKILERVVCNQLSDYLMQNNLHDPNQSGFKAAHSTETALFAVTEKLHAARSAKLSLVLILLDLSAAFDTVNHKTLLSTLRSLGICGTAWEWFASYLDGRSYQVKWKGLTSAPRRLSTGVPQGSVLGPLLFSLYTHSLGKVTSSHGFSYHCYADDTQLIFPFPPSDTMASARISACLVDISSWMTAHQLKLNPSKTELLVIPGDPSPAQDLAISLNNSMISPSATARNLGVAQVGGLPPGVVDVWEELGKQEHCRYTWDTKMNNNKDVSYISRCRFDRIYLRPAKTGAKVSPEHIVLVGMEKLDCARYTSDHWGIYCSFTSSAWSV